MTIPSVEEVNLRSQLDASVGRLHAALSRCPVIDDTLTDERLDEADAIIDAADAEIRSAQAIAASLEHLVGASEEAVLVGNVARVALEIAICAVSSLRAELDYRRMAA